MTLSKEEIRNIIAKRIAKEFNDGDVITLGIGLPTLASNYIPEDKHVILQSENGVLGVASMATGNDIDESITNAGGGYISIQEGGCFFDSLMSFSMIRGRHINITVLGGLQVDEEGNLANWLIPGKMASGMGGAMDLVVGAQRVIVAMEHTAKDNPKILKKCTLPLTAKAEVDLIITEKCVMSVGKNGLVLEEITPYSNLADIKATTQADFTLSDNLKLKLGL